jgi:hypothetical protein
VVSLPESDPNRTNRRPTLYFVIIRRDAALGVCSAGEITNVTQAFLPSGRSGSRIPSSF